ncbi:MAG: 50S ribosomal protein L18 [Candidatus Shikimatogenerans sp. Tser]|uniref:50S ribosomal protein L18 n=1 Tax=Candidatus Shikimatogenerans sp. Tser TaxID=3158568 RepID=A0AAU7QR20_9FLAO
MKHQLSIYYSNKHIYIQIINLNKNIIVVSLSTNNKKYLKLNKKKQKKKLLKEIIKKIYKNKINKLFINKTNKYKGFNKILIDKLKFYKLI